MFAMNATIAVLAYAEVDLLPILIIIVMLVLLWFDIDVDVDVAIYEYIAVVVDSSVGDYFVCWWCWCYRFISCLLILKFRFCSVAVYAVDGIAVVEAVDLFMLDLHEYGIEARVVVDHIMLLPPSFSLSLLPGLILTDCPNQLSQPRMQASG